MSGAEVVSDMQRPGDRRLEVATFDVNGVALITPGERTVVQISDSSTNVAATEASPDIDATGSVSSNGAQQ